MIYSTERHGNTIILLLWKAAGEKYSQEGTGRETLEKQEILSHALPFFL